MDYFQGNVETYLRADKASFNNPEFYLRRSENYESGKTNWYVDVLNVNFRDRTAYLCEITYAKHPNALRRRLRSWFENWPTVVTAVQRDALVPRDWKVRVWVFCPLDLIDKVLSLIPTFECPPRLTPLEWTLPWKYSESNRIGEQRKPDNIPESMRM